MGRRNLLWLEFLQASRTYTYGGALEQLDKKAVLLEFELVGR
jgi:hypothetical protein